jgi:superfamily II DNA or RNA helicase
VNIVIGTTWAEVTDFTQEELEVLSQRLTFSEQIRDDIVLTEFLRKDRSCPYFLSGLIPLLDDLPFSVDIKDKRPKPNLYIDNISDDLLSGVKLRPYQCHAIKKCLMWGRGILWIPTRGGKTEVFAGVTKILTNDSEFSGNILIIVPDRMLLRQTYDRLKTRGIESVGRLGDGFKEIDARVCVGIINTLYNMARDEKYNEFFNSTQCVIIDEVHHLVADSYQFLAERCSHTKYTIGVSGTPFKDGESSIISAGHAALLGYFHQVIMQVTTEFLIQNGYIAEPNVFFLQYPMESKPTFFIEDYHKVYDKFIVKNESRNILAAKIAVRLSSLEFSTLISVLRLEQGFILLNMIAEHLPETIFVSSKYGVLSKYSPELYKELQKDFNVSKFILQQTAYIQYPEDFPYESWFAEKRFKVLIGSSIFDEGRDLPTLDGVILMGGGGKSEVKNIQRPARALTKSSSTSRVYIIDFNDIHHVYLKNHSELRRQSFLRHSYRVHYGMDELGKFITTLVSERQQAIKEISQ